MDYDSFRLVLLSWKYMNNFLILVIIQLDHSAGKCLFPSFAIDFLSKVCTHPDVAHKQSDALSKARPILTYYEAVFFGVIFTHLLRALRVDDSLRAADFAFSEIGKIAFSSSLERRRELRCQFSSN